MWEFFPNRGPPPIPLFGNFFPILPFIFGRSPMLNTVKNGCGIRVDHPPCFFKIPTFSRFFFGRRPLFNKILKPNRIIMASTVCLFVCLFVCFFLFVCLIVCLFVCFLSSLNCHWVPKRIILSSF